MKYIAVFLFGLAFTFTCGQIAQWLCDWWDRRKAPKAKRLVIQGVAFHDLDEAAIYFAAESELAKRRRDAQWDAIGRKLDECVAESGKSATNMAAIRRRLNEPKA